MEHRFYRLTSSKTPSALARLAATAIERKLKATIYCNSEEQSAMISERIWADFPFLAHSLGEHDGVAPLHITHSGSAMGEVLLIADNAEPGVAASADQISRQCYVFSAFDKEIEARRREDWKRLKECGETLSYWVEDEEGRWSLAAQSPADRSEGES